MAEFAIFQINLLKKCGIVLNCRLKCQSVKCPFCRWAITFVLAGDSQHPLQHVCHRELTCAVLTCPAQGASQLLSLSGCFLKFLYAESCKCGRKLKWSCSFLPCCLQLGKTQIPFLKKDWSSLRTVVDLCASPKMHPGNGSLGVFRVRDWRWRECCDESRFSTCQVWGIFCMGVEIS